MLEPTRGNSDIPLDEISPADETEHGNIVNAIWGAISAKSESKDRLQVLRRYLEYCDKEKSFTLSCNPDALDEVNLVTLIQHVKAQVQDSRREIIAHQTEDLGLRASGTALDLVVRLVFLTACISSSEDTFGGALFRPKWKESEPLAGYIERVYPRTNQPPQDVRPLRIDKLSAGYLFRYTSLDLVWTHQLTDHLTLLKRHNKKILYIFRHPAFLTVSLTTLAANNPALGHTTAQALTLGCLPPGLLRETLATFKILFPEPGDELSQVFLRREVANAKLDDSFLRPLPPHFDDHEHPQDALDPEDVRGLYQKYPYWGDRLYALWKEADDPMLTTNLGRWAETKQNPRLTFWCTGLSLGIAFALAIVVTTLIAAQFWISYCEWIDDPNKPMCWKESPSP